MDKEITKQEREERIQYAIFNSQGYRKCMEQAKQKNVSQFLSCIRPEFWEPPIVQEKGMKYCSICVRGFKTFKSLESHMKEHEPFF
jgi:hypothetical protein